MAVALRTSNPALRSDAFARQPRAFGAEVMTVQGTATKALVLLLLALVTASYTWREIFVGGGQYVGPLMMVGTIGGLILAVITVFKQAWSPVTAPLYAAFEGLALGGISAYFESRFPGIAIQAVGLTLAVFVALLLAYKTGTIQATDRFKRGIIAATGGVMILYVVEMVLSFFGIHIPYIHESGLIGIGFSAVICVVAALNLILDFDLIEQGARRGAPKHMEWYGAFALMVTLVWLYLELLRLLAKLRQND